MHRTAEEAKEETLRMFNVYKTFQEDFLALPVITGKKTEKEKFAGAEETYTLEAMMYNGYALQMVQVIILVIILLKRLVLNLRIVIIL